MLSGINPFKIKGQNKYQRMNTITEYEFDDTYIYFSSEEAKDLVSQLLNSNVRESF